MTTLDRTRYDANEYWLNDLESDLYYLEQTLWQAVLRGSVGFFVGGKISTFIRGKMLRVQYTSGYAGGAGAKALIVQHDPVREPARTTLCDDIGRAFEECFEMGARVRVSEGRTIFYIERALI